jgi:tetratricopeptide (TPR) repeat protein
MRRLAVLALLVLVALPPVGAQKKSNVPARPKLVFTTDTNDAEAYYQLGQVLLAGDPKQAADAFYWTTRLNPNAANAFYGRHAALLLADPSRLARYMDRDYKKRPSAELMQIDSLQARALMLNPFLYRKYDQVVLRRYFEHVVLRYSSGVYAPSTAAVDRAYYEWLAHAGPSIKALAAYCSGRLDDALRAYAEAIVKAKEKSYFRVERGRTFLLVGQPDSALAEIRLALDELRKRDSKELVVLYSSKAMLEHSIAKIHEARGDSDSAQAAYGRALEEDLAFYPAHVNLGMLALQAGDTATGLSELELAVQIRGDEPMLRLFYGYLLAQVNRFAEAEAQLTKAIELEPYYARSYQLLGQVYYVQRKSAEAIVQYEAYLARAALTDAPRQDIMQQLEVLRAMARGRSD